MSPGAQAEGQPQPAVPSFQVRTARQLFEALESPDGGVRLAALQAIQQAPSTALSFGLHAKRDLLDVLLSQAERFRGEFEWMNWLGAIAGFREPRVVRLFTSLITTESHGELLFALANYLQSEPLDSLRIPLGEALMQNDCVARARAVAPLLATCPGLSTGEALRIGLLKPRGETPLPAFSKSTAEWLSELAGPFQLEAQLELKRQGASTLTALVGTLGSASGKHQEMVSGVGGRNRRECSSRSDSRSAGQEIRRIAITGTGGRGRPERFSPGPRRLDHPAAGAP